MFPVHNRKVKASSEAKTSFRIITLLITLLVAFFRAETRLEAEASPETKTSAEAKTSPEAKASPETKTSAEAKTSPEAKISLKVEKASRVTQPPDTNQSRGNDKEHSISVEVRGRQREAISGSDAEFVQHLRSHKSSNGKAGWLPAVPPHKCLHGASCVVYRCIYWHPPDRLSKCELGGSCPDFECESLHPNTWFTEQKKAQSKAPEHSKMRAQRTKSKIKKSLLYSCTVVSTRRRCVRWSDESAPDFGQSDAEKGLCTIRMYYREESLEAGSIRRQIQKKGRVKKKEKAKRSAGAWLPPHRRRRSET